MSASFSTAAYVDAVRETNPLVQCLTNTVIAQFTANVLLAAGASPAMCDNPQEAGQFASFTHGILANIGTMNPDQYAGMMLAARVAADKQVPWVLDPVAVGPLTYRTELAATLVDAGPTVLRGNASEVGVVVGVGAGGKGVDATDSVDAIADTARQFARETGIIVAASGPRDLITDGTCDVWVRGGDPMMTKVVGTGCALGALVAAYLGAARVRGLDDRGAVVAAHAHAAAAGTMASRSATGPGSFHVAFIDALYQLSGADIDELIDVEEA